MKARFRVTGRVQGVGFRWFTRGSAERLGLTGWCRNTSDGAVEGEVWGDEPTVQQFREALLRGPRASRVDGLDFEVAEAGTAPDGFDIRY